MHKTRVRLPHSQDNITRSPERIASSGHQPILQCPPEDSPVGTGGRCSGLWSAVRRPPHRAPMPTCAPAGGHVTQSRQGYIHYSLGKGSISLLYRFDPCRKGVTFLSHFCRISVTRHTSSALGGSAEMRQKCDRNVTLLRRTSYSYAASYSV